MFCKLKTPLDLMAVVVDKDKRIAETIDVNCLQVVNMQINWLARKAFFTIAFGGCDSNGKFHIDPTRKDELANCVIPDPDFGEFFEDENGNPKRGFPQDLIDSVIIKALPIADKMCWTFDEIDIALDGKSVFAKAAISDKIAKD